VISSQPLPRGEKAKTASAAKRFETAKAALEELKARGPGTTDADDFDNAVEELKHEVFLAKRNLSR